MEPAISVWRVPDNYRTCLSLEKITLTLAPKSLDEATRQLPGGAYTTFRTFGQYQVLNLTDHLNRLEETARLDDKPVTIDRSTLKMALHEAFEQFPSNEKRVRVILDLSHNLGALYILIEKLVVPSSQDYEQGVKVITRAMRRQNPRAKLTGFIETAETVRQEVPEGIHEVVMVDEQGRALEGLSSNFFAVKDGVIWTAAEGVLAGITRQTVLDIIRAQGIPLHLEGIPVEGVADLDEAFLTSTSRAVLPIREIDGHIIGAGAPGEVTRAIMAAFQEQIDKNVETV
jgi:branched-chain amino acid aminotransferase